jgi:hypothetical protein
MLSKIYNFKSYCDENNLEYSYVDGIWVIGITGKHDSTIKFIEENIGFVGYNYSTVTIGLKSLVFMSDANFSKELVIKNTFLDVNVEGHLFRLVIDKKHKNGKIEYIKQLRNLCPINATKIGKWDTDFNCSHNGKLHLKEAKEIIEYALEYQSVQYTDLNVGLYLL